MVYHPYPLLPLTPTWSNTESFTTDIAKSQYGRAGVEARSLYSINPINASWDINVNIRNFQEVDDFLRSRRGQPFCLSLDGGITDDGRFYMCTDWQIQQLGVGVGNFSATISQVRRFPPPPFQVICNDGYPQKGKILEFKNIGFGKSFTFYINVSSTHSGYGIIQVHKWINDDFDYFDNREWIADVEEGGFFQYIPSVSEKYLSFSHHNPDTGFWDTPFFSINNDVVILDRFY